jgi:hypothetical protein
MSSGRNQHPSGQPPLQHKRRRHPTMPTVAHSRASRTIPKLENPPAAATA